MVRYRVERDFLGPVKVPGNAYYGVETERARKNFQISGITVPLEFIRAYALIKRSAAKANMKEGKLDRRIGGAVVMACSEVMAGKLADQFIVDVFQAGAGTSTNMNVNEVVANRAIELLGGSKGDYKLVHPNDHVNMSQSTNDSYHAAIHVATYMAVRGGLLPALSGLEKTLHAKSVQFSKIVKIGRTHLQDAVPIALGQEFSGYEHAISEAADRLKISCNSLLALPLGGTAVGTGIETKREYPRDVVTELNRATKCRFKVAENFFSMQQNQNEERWASAALAGVAITVGKIANDLRLLSSGPVAGLGDITLPAVQPGSSIMPGKVNPSMAEMMNMVCFEVLGKDTAVEHAAAGGQLELNVFMPLVAYNLLYSSAILSNGISAFTERCVSGIRANTERISYYLEKDISLATALAPYIGYSKASEIANEARRSGRTVKEVCIDRKIMPRDQLDKILDPASHIRPE